MTMDSELIKLINNFRIMEDISPLTQDTSLNRAASKHAAFMLQTKTLSHLGRDSTRFTQRITDENMVFDKAAENIALATTNPAEILELWMGSPTHRQNILNPAFTTVGVGIAPLSDKSNHPEKTYWSLSLIEPAKKIEEDIKPSSIADPISSAASLDDSAGSNISH